MIDFFKLPRFNLRLKLLIANSIAILAAGILILIFIKTVYFNSLLGHLQGKQIYMAEELSVSAADDILKGNIVGLEIRINDFKAKLEDIEYVFIMDEQGNILAHTFGNGFPSALKEMRSASLGAKPKVEEILMDKKHIYDISAPVLKGTAGEVHIGSLKIYLQKDLDQLIRMIILIIAAGLVISIALAIVFSRWIIFPIVALTNTVRLISLGNVKLKAQIRGDDEVAELSRAFNKLIEDLQKTQEKIKITQAQLIQSSKMAAVGQLAGGVAHEINNPLTGILNNLQIVKMKLVKKEECSVADFKKILDVVEEEASRCSNITKSLLDFSRMGKRPHGVINLSDILDKSIALVGNEMKIANIKLIKEYAPGLPHTKGDSNQLQQVFLDIFNNAKWAIKEKNQGAEIKVKVYFLRSKKSLVVEISDNGCGITEKDMEHLFEPFFTTKKIGEGTGLGLSICYNIIKEHEGTIEVESQGKNKGSTFRVILPVILE